MAPPADCRKDGLDCPKAEEAADAAVKKTFAIMGVDITKPESVEEFRMDLRFAGQLRQDMQDSKKTARRTLIAIVLTALASALGVGIKLKMGGG